MEGVSGKPEQAHEFDAANVGLLIRSTIRDFLLKNAVWSDSRGARGDYLSSGLLYYYTTAQIPQGLRRTSARGRATRYHWFISPAAYYTFVHVLHTRGAVCLGSGGGFVPRLMRQAQRDRRKADICNVHLLN